MSIVTFERIPHDLPAQRWLYRLSKPIRFSKGATKPYDEGDEVTAYVVVSWGRYGDTSIFPADSDGRILDMLGFNGRMGWDEPDARLSAWLDGEVSPFGCGLSFAQVAQEAGATS